MSQVSAPGSNPSPSREAVSPAIPRRPWTVGLIRFGGSVIWRAGFAGPVPQAIDVLAGFRGGGRSRKAKRKKRKDRKKSKSREAPISPTLPSPSQLRSAMHAPMRFGCVIGGPSLGDVPVADTAPDRAHQATCLNEPMSTDLRPFAFFAFFAVESFRLPPPRTAAAAIPRRCPIIRTETLPNFRRHRSAV